MIRFFRCLFFCRVRRIRILIRRGKIWVGICGLCMIGFGWFFRFWGVWGWRVVFFCWSNQWVCCLRCQIGIIWCCQRSGFYLDFLIFIWTRIFFVCHRDYLFLRISFYFILLLLLFWRVIIFFGDLGHLIHYRSRWEISRVSWDLTILWVVVWMIF